MSDPDAIDAADRSVLALARSGVYPITVELVVDGAVVATSETFIDRLPATPAAARPVTQVAVVADVADPGPSPDAGRDRPPGAPTCRRSPRAPTPSAARSPCACRRSIADEIETQDPALLATLREAFAGAEVLAAPSPTLDPSAAAAAGLQDAFSRALRAGEDEVGAALPASPPLRSGWLVDDPISTSAAAMLRDPLGFDLLVVRRRRLRRPGGRDRRLPRLVAGVQRRGRRRRHAARHGRQPQQPLARSRRSRPPSAVADGRRRPPDGRARRAPGPRPVAAAQRGPRAARRGRARSRGGRRARRATSPRRPTSG